LKRHKLASLVVLGVASLSLLWATGLLSLPWTHDLDFQVAIKPQKMPLMPPDGTVPITGRIDDGIRENANSLTSDVPADTTSLRKGKIAFDTYCAPCHGVSGEGNGTVAKHLPIPPINLTDAAIQAGRSDGAIYYTIRHGGAIMPGYAYALSRERAWDVVHYVRTLKTP
jgi:mono/diheme cytochrome c family protein